MDSSYLGAYWGSRPESSLQCGRRLANCVARLSEIDEALGSWFRKGASKAAAKTPVDLDAESLGRLFAQGVNRRDFGGDVIEELGFSVGVWNRARPTVGLYVTAGAFPSFAGVLNCFVFDFPPPKAEALRLYEPGVAGAILDAVVESWEPDWATWTTDALRDVQDAAPREPVIGWMTYLSTPLTADLPVASRALLDGTVVTIGQDVSSVGEQAVLDVRSRMAAVGALRPIA